MSQTEDCNATLHNLLTEIIRDRVGLHERYACMVASDILVGLAAARGGEWVYVPKTRLTMPRAQRDDAVRRLFNGANRDVVCETFGISRSLFYEILSRAATSSPGLGVTAGQLDR